MNGKKKTIRKFDKDFMLDVLCEDADDVRVVSDEIVDTSRWSIYHDLIFSFENKFYNTQYSVGATEYQDERPWEVLEYVDCTEVAPVERIITVYEPV